MNDSLRKALHRFAGPPPLPALPPRPRVVRLPDGGEVPEILVLDTLRAILADVGPLARDPDGDPGVVAFGMVVLDDDQMALLERIQRGLA